jgi:hypothetical protein
MIKPNREVARMSVKRFAAIMLAAVMLCGINIVPSADAAGFDYEIKVSGRVDNTVRYNSRNTYTLEFQVKTNNSAVINGNWSCEIAYDTSVFELVTMTGTQNLSQAGISVTPGAFYTAVPPARGFSSVFSQWWQPLLHVALSSGGETGYVSMQAMTPSSDPSEFTALTTLQTVRFAFRPGMSLENVTADSIRFALPHEMGSLGGVTSQVLIADGYNFYEYGTASDSPNTLSTPSFVIEKGQQTAINYIISATAGVGGSVSCGGTFTSGASVALTATPNSGYVFDGWFANGVRITGAGATYTFTATSNRTLEARFNQGNSGGNNSGNGNTGSGGSAGNNSDAPTTQPPTTPPPTTPSETTENVVKNGKTIPATATADGITFIFTAEIIAENRDNTGEYTIEITGRDEIGINLPISALNGDGVMIVTEFGSIYFSNSALQAIGGTLRLVIRKSSFQVALLDASNNEVVYNNPANPLYIRIPITLAADTSTNGYVAVQRTATGNVIMPYSVYNNGEVIFQSATTGTFDTIYNVRAFSDISGHWAASYINFASARALVSGDGTGKFNPNANMTRAAFAQILANIEGIDLSVFTTSRFTDVAVGIWYAPAVEWAASVGLVSGYGNGRFGPEDNITREQMAALLANYLRYKGYTLPAGQTTAFNDDASISSWARDGVKMIQAAGIISGKPGNIFDPQGTAIRAEVATIFARFISVVVAP